MSLLFRLISPFHLKAKKWLAGRQDYFKKLSARFKGQDDLFVWIHCASLGEFEQGRPILEALKRDGHKILLSFYSPSGYEVRKNYSEADHVIYLPVDTKKNAEKFLDTINIKCLIIVKYDLWYNVLAEIHKRKIPAFLISATFKEKFVFFKWYGGFQRTMLTFFNRIYVQDLNSKKLLDSINIKSIVAGDSRIDRVLEISSNNRSFSQIEAFCKDSKILIAGSTWPTDEDHIGKLIKKDIFQDWKLIIAPHETDSKHIQEIEGKFRIDCLKFSDFNAKSDNKVLIIDSIGILSQIYKYADLVYIGGGFGKSIHNILEPASFSKPIIFGPNYHNFEEAITLVKNQGAFEVNSADHLARIFSKLQDPAQIIKAKKAIQAYMTLNKGASKIILKEIKKFVD